MSLKKILPAVLVATIGLGPVSSVDAAPFVGWFIPKPDLQVVSAYAVNNGYYDVMSFTVKNNGPGFAGAFQILVSGQGYAKWFVVSGLGWGQSATFYWATPTVGYDVPYSRVINVDYSNSVNEWNEKNNKYALHYHLPPMIK